MKNFPVQVNDKEFWISRSLSVEGFIFTYNKGLKILANKRGKACPNNIGKWNCPCGYLDYDETLQQACSREIKEETGLIIDPSLLEFLWIDSSPKGKTQNVSVAFFSYESNYENQILTTEFADLDEVEEIKWIGIEELDKYDWAFEHNYSIIRISLEYFKKLLPEEIKRRFEEQLKERIILGTNA